MHAHVHTHINTAVHAHWYGAPKHHYRIYYNGKDYNGKEKKSPYTQFQLLAFYAHLKSGVLITAIYIPNPPMRMFHPPYTVNTQKHMLWGYTIHLYFLWSYSCLPSSLEQLSHLPADITEPGVKINEVRVTKVEFKGCMILSMRNDPYNYYVMYVYSIVCKFHQQNSYMASSLMLVLTL